MQGSESRIPADVAEVPDTVSAQLMVVDEPDTVVDFTPEDPEVLDDDGDG